MRAFCKEAAEFAVQAHKKGKTCVMVAPDRSWEAAIRDLGTPPPGIFIRYACSEHSLLAARVDVLITLEAWRFTPHGLYLAKNLTRCALHPEWIDIAEYVTVKTGHDEIWK